MAASMDQVAVDVMSCDLIGEMQLDIQSVISTNVNFSKVPPMPCYVYHRNSYLHFQINLKHSAETDMIEANLEVLSGVVNNLRFKIRYGFNPFIQYRAHAQIFVCTPTNKRSNDYPICKFKDLLEYMVQNELALKNEPIEFISTITVSLRDTKAMITQYSIPTVNASDCDHTLICEGHEIRTHKYILMGASKYFLRRLTENPLFVVTSINKLEDIDLRIDKETLTSMLRFMYGLNVSEHDLGTTNLLSAARAFEVNKLFQICEDSLIKELSPQLAPELFYIGRTEAAYRLTVEAAKYIVENYLAVKKCFEWNAIMLLFPDFFKEIKENPLKYFREILLSRSMSDGELNVRTGVSFLRITQPEIVITRPLTDVSQEETKSEKIEGETEATTIDESRGSDDATLFECESLDLDLEPVPRKRSSPVVSRRRSDSSSSLGALRRSESTSSSLDAYRMKSLQDTLPRIKFSRESLKQKLLANEPKFEEDFGPVESMPGPIRALYRTTSLPTENTFRLQDRSDKEYKSTARAHSDQEYKLRFPKKRFDIPMDCRDDSKLGGSKDSTKDSSNSPRSMGPGTLSGERPDLSSPSLKSMRSLEFGFTYSYSSDSVFERESPKSMSKVPTPPQPMSVSEISSKFHDITASPRLMKRLDFQMFTHPEARSLSDISSIPMDPSTSLEPDSSSSSRTRKRREKRSKKSSDNKRKLLPGATPFDFSSSEGSTSLIPRPTFSKEKSTAKRQFPSQFQQKSIRTNSPLGSSEITSPESMSSKKVTFGETDFIQSYAEDVDLNEPEEQQVKYYFNWIDAAKFYNIQDVFEQDPNIQGVSEQCTTSNVEDVEDKPWDEKDEEELTAPLLKKINKQFQKGSSSSSSAAAAQELPIGGGVIRKAGKHRMASIDDPAPLSSSESAGTTSSSISSTTIKKSISELIEDLYSKVEKKPKQKKMETDTSSDLVRTQSYTDLRRVYATPTEPHQRRTTPTLAGVYSLEVLESDIEQPIPSAPYRKDTKEDLQNVKSEISGVADVKPMIEKDPQ